MKKAFITGITGQDGSYLAELLQAKGYKVWGLSRRSSSPNTSRIDHLQNLNVLTGDITDGGRLFNILADIQPDEVYHLAAQSDVGVSFASPEYTIDANATGTIQLLEALRRLDNPPRYYQASSSEIYGKVREVPQTETTPFYPRSPYGCSKLFGYWQTVNYREAYGLFACNGILFNHESPRRGESFVTRKITRAAGRIKLGLQETLYLGNLDSRRDWGFSRDYVEAMWLMLQQDTPDDYVVATGETHSVREFLDEVFGHLNLDWQDFVKIDPQLYRPTEVDLLLGNPAKAKKVLGWEPRVKFKELAKMMAESDLVLAEHELAIQSLHGRERKIAA